MLLSFLSQWLDSISRPASITHTLMSLKLPSSPAFSIAASHTQVGGPTYSTQIFLLDIMKSCCFFPFFFPSPNSLMLNDIRLSFPATSLQLCSTNFLTLGNNFAWLPSWESCPFALVTMLSLGVSPVVTEAYFLLRKLTKFVCKIFNCTTTLQIVAATDSLEMYDKYNKNTAGPIFTVI